MNTVKILGMQTRFVQTDMKQMKLLSKYGSFYDK